MTKKDALLEHEYDGIAEYDNPLPGWWKSIFWVTFVFAVGYMMQYHCGGSGASVKELYAEDVRAAEARRQAMASQVTEESLRAILADADRVTAGKQVYATRCAVCHLHDGGGSVGPNLTDDAWIHGTGSLPDILAVVTDGVPSKGMLAWGGILKPAELHNVVAYVTTLRGTNVAGGKPPEGRRVDPTQAVGDAPAEIP